jgi:exodeoxyribonuclease V alpha subunit
MVQNRHGNFSQIDPRKDLDLAYAITTHKSQGSEYKNVVYILNKSNLFMINRRNTYTAVTRAREHVYLIADQKGLSAGVYRKEGN